MDKYQANINAVNRFNADFTRYKPITIQQSKYLNNRIEQNHRFIKRRGRPMLEFKVFHSTQILLTGIKLMHMFHKGQFSISKNDELSPTEQYHVLVA